MNILARKRKPNGPDGGTHLFVILMETILQERLSQTTGIVGKIHLQSIGGGSINQTFRAACGNKQFFCKINSATKFPHLFSKEKNGLRYLEKQHLVKTPAVIDCFEKEGWQVLVLDWITEGERTDRFWRLFGEQLASLHLVTADEYGFTEDNYMGSVPQSNRPHKSWIQFFTSERLSPMVRRCADKHLLGKEHLRQFEAIENKLPGIFEEEKPSLVHGDLWSGNFLCDQDASPVLIDPAACFCHRSVDLGMTVLFGGFEKTFYEAYHHHFPFPPRHREQWAVCNLYPLLIHLFLFGTGYLPQIERTLKQFT